jgi:AbrB family looped-hinge helix DNA binding protein
MKDLSTIVVTKVGQSTLPKWWRESSGLREGGIVEVRPVKDGKNSILLTPRPARRRGAVGLARLFSKCPYPMEAPARTQLPFK